TPKTVNYYAEHNDNGRPFWLGVATTLASFARRRIASTQKGGCKKAFGSPWHLDLKPLTAEDFKKQ
ncbi:hypothetical protein XPU_0808, partial [Xanthomonas arboricola pv. pruni str. MAFF 311562]